MSSIEYLKVFVNERLTAAAEEIFVVFKRTIVAYEEEIDHQRKLLDDFWKPEIKLNRLGTAYTPYQYTNLNCFKLKYDDLLLDHFVIHAPV